MIARRIGNQLKGEGSVTVLGINWNNSGLTERMRSFEVTLKTEFPKVRIQSSYLDSRSEAQAEQIAHEVLSNDGGPNAILALTGTATSGVIRAIDDSSSNRKIFLVSCDQTYNGLNPLAQGKIDAVIAENTFVMGDAAAHLIMEAHSGGVLTKTIYVKPALVTRDNMFSPELHKSLTYDTRALY